MSTTSGAGPGTGTVNQGSPSDGDPRGGRRGARASNHGRGSGGRRNERPQRAPARKFMGKEEGLGAEYVYKYTQGQQATVDQYACTTEEIVRYSITKYKNGADVERSLGEEAMFVVGIPAVPTGACAPRVVADTDMIVWKPKVQMALQRTIILEANLQSAYAMIKGQCSKPNLEKVEGQVGYAAIHQRQDSIRLLGLIKGVMFNYNSRKYRAMSIIGIAKFNLIAQTRYMSDSKYLEKFRTKLEVLESTGGNVCAMWGMYTDALDRAGFVIGGTNIPTDEQKAAARMRG